MLETLNVDAIQELIRLAIEAPQRPQRVAAYGRLVAKFRDMACAYACSILGDFHQAEDAAQEAFVLAFERLGQLQQPAAFPGWLRRIVWSVCTRLLRSRPQTTLGLQAANATATPEPGPPERAQRDETREQVMHAIGRLPPDQREVTLLFYISGYTQHDVAEFLDVPVHTVKNRLYAARAQLKQRMLPMIKNTLHDAAPDDRFNQRIIAELLAWPQPLEVPGHPIRQVLDALRQSLPGFEQITGDELLDARDIVNPWIRQFAFAAEPGKVLRPETTAVTFSALAKRRPPLRLFVAGRAFRNAPEDQRKLRVFHQFDAICVDSGASEQLMRQTLQRLIDDLFGPTQLRYEPTTLAPLSPCYKISAQLAGTWHGVAGCGMIKNQVLEQAGHNPAIVSGFALAAELDNLALLKFNIDDVRRLWQPPLLPATPQSP